MRLLLTCLLHLLLEKHSLFRHTCVGVWAILYMHVTPGIAPRLCYLTRSSVYIREILCVFVCRIHSRLVVVRQAHAPARDKELEKKPSMLHLSGLSSPLRSMMSRVGTHRLMVMPPQAMVLVMNLVKATTTTMVLAMDRLALTPLATPRTLRTRR